MRILQTIRSVNPERGGVIEVVKQFSRVLESQGHDVTIASLDAPQDPWVLDCPHRVEALGNVVAAPRQSAAILEKVSGALPSRRYDGSSNYGASPQFVRWVRENAAEFDAFVVNGIWQYNSYGLWKALYGMGKPYFVFPHGMLDPWFKRTYPLKHLKKWLYWPWAEYRVLRDAHAVLFTCEEEKRLARESFWLYRCNERVVTLGIAKPSGAAAAQRELFLAAFPECRGKRLILFLGRIHEKKGCDLLIRAFADVASLDPNLLLVMAGPEQQDAGTWRAMANELGVRERVVWTGMLSGDLKWGALHAAEVFALPSHQENFGIAVVEALACGVPVLISREVNIWREIVAAAAGLADDDSVEGATRLLRTWLTKPPVEREQMRQQAKECFVERFDIESATQNLLGVLRNGNGGAS